MNPIVTITFNPCIDKSLETEKLIPEKKLACSAPRLEPGGGGINVARAVRRLGGHVLAVYPEGGYHGTLLTEMLRMEQVDILPIPMLADIREDINVRERSTNQQYRFIEPGPVLTEHVYARCLDAAQTVDKGGILVVSGSLPPGWPADLWKRIALIAQKRNARLVVDTKGPSLQAALAAGVYLVKPNAGELDAVARGMGMQGGKPGEDARAIVTGGQAEVVVVSGGSEGALLVTKDMVIGMKAPEVKRLSTVGAGDSMVAGIVLGLSRKMNIAEAVRFGVACGAAAVMNPGTELCHKKDAEQIYMRMLEAVSTGGKMNAAGAFTEKPRI